MVGMAAEGPTEGAAYFAKNRVTLDVLAPEAVEPDIGVGNTPTLLLVGPEQKVVRVWHGELDPPEEAMVLSRVRQLCPRCTE